MPSIQPQLLHPALLPRIQKALATGAFDIRVLTKEVDGRPRVVVLAGSIHFKTPNEAQAEKELITKFHLRGWESYDPSKTWGGPFFNAYLAGHRRIDHLLSLLRRVHPADPGELPKGGEALDQGPLENINLEADHRPDIYENIASIYRPALFAVVALLIG